MEFIVVYRTYGKNVDNDIYEANSEEEAERLFEEDNTLNKWGYKFLGAIEYA